MMQNSCPKAAATVGKVWLVGAGPGDPELLTLKALKVLKRCNVWLVDDLAGAGVLALAPEGTRVLNVGKRGGCRSTAQSFILRLMSRYALQGHIVARVKGGDPFIFGRGGEEMAWLAERGIPVDSVSGITAGLAVGSAYGLPLTHRDMARGVAFVTAHTSDGSRPDWASLANSGLTIVCYMGMNHIDNLVTELLTAGFAAGLPVAVAQSVTQSSQRQIFTTLQRAAQDARAAGMGSPAVIVLGKVVNARHAATPCDAPWGVAVSQAI